MLYLHFLQQIQVPYQEVFLLLISQLIHQHLSHNPAVAYLGLCIGNSVWFKSLAQLHSSHYRTGLSLSYTINIRKFSDFCKSEITYIITGIAYYLFRKLYCGPVSAARPYYKSQQLWIAEATRPRKEIYEIVIILFYVLIIYLSIPVLAITRNFFNDKFDDICSRLNIIFYQDVV